jgi:predicted amidohydrolase
MKRNVEEASTSIELAAAEDADLVVLPEVFALQDCADWPAHAEPLDGYVISALAKLARGYDIGIAAGHGIRIDNKIYNSLVLLGRGGEIAALYHKAYPTIWELENGIMPGEGAVVCDTEFGRVGFAICYDLNFSELRFAYRDQNPDLILFSSMFRGGLQTRWWAYEARSYLVSSVIDPQSLIVNPLGRVVAETDVWSRSITRTINLDYAVVHLDYTNTNLHEARLKNGADFDFDWAEAEGIALVTARGEKSVRELMREYNWQTVEEYFARSRAAREDVLSGRAIIAGPSPW